MTEQEKLKKIQQIKSHEEPPWSDDDIYWHRKPWQKFGGVSSGICMCWGWYRDDIILDKASDEDIEMALAEFAKDENSKNHEKS